MTPAGRQTNTGAGAKFWIAATLGLAALSSAVLGGCHAAQAPPMHPVGAPGRWVTVAPGETLADIARRAGVPEADLLEANGLHSAAEVQPGRLIFVLDPPAAVADEGEEAPEATGAADGPEPAAPSSSSSSAQAATRGHARFRWPVDAPRLTSVFGSRWGRPHEGIDLTAPIGTPVYAADAGEVIYAGNRVRGYGNMVVVNHGGDLMTVYAHNSVLLVKVGERVAAGQRVALSGQSGRATGPHVHFEVRRGQVPRDPLPYLPSLRPRSPKS